jgi:hypothetical protein
MVAIRTEANLDTLHSCQSRSPPKEAIRSCPRADQRPNNEFRKRDIQHRDRKHKQGNAGRHEERQRGHEANPRRSHNRQGRPDNVCLHSPLTKLTPDKLDTDVYYREDLREQHAIGEEIGEAITQSIGNQGLDEAELDDELEALQQEVLDDKMLHTGQVPVADQIGRLPSAPDTGKFANAPRLKSDEDSRLIRSAVKGKAPVIAEEEDEEEELRKLQAEMAM